MIWMIPVVLLLAILEWVSEVKKITPLKFITKPATMIALIAWVLLTAGQAGVSSPGLTWFVIGLVLCLFGDIFLMFPPEKFFMPGLVSFLLGHVAYILAFGVFSFTDKTMIPAILLILFLAIVALRIFKSLKAGLKASGKEKLIIPVGVYSVVISYMLFSAAYSFLTPEWSTSEAYLVVSGALLFYISDILNAWERFVSPLENAKLKIMITYHLGQILLSVGVVLHFVGVS